eukprot:SAG22_NODE_682_length_7924_cov_25.432460_4_plen_259_part_00
MQRGDHPDHADVTCAGDVVDGQVCLLYLGGEGEMVFTCAATGEERRVALRPNLAVSWPNGGYTHRVEAGPAAAKLAPRLMIGPYYAAGTGTGGGSLARCMSPAALFGGGSGGRSRFSGPSMGTVALLIAGATVAAPLYLACVVGQAVLQIPLSVVYVAAAAPAAMGAEIGGPASLGSQVREGRQGAGYRFGDFTRGIFAKGAADRSGNAADEYHFGDFLRGVFTSSSDPQVRAVRPRPLCPVTRTRSPHVARRRPCCL